ncbi:TonB-dependent siderophore receptor [Brenneria roseae subsp. americana]|uniref:TonB-dependent siderophore receptor n=1 Tax=Brenneria roseae subsp. americana TaxID=1508507 RepID=A0A2U1TND3_9GAMM|nr:TonB-dependent siderophore receptor [Brenneria roseae]PWC10899.1 TonB-dependent siderophore receptor [Brenneria roseae subsp. americana]
MMTYTVIRHTRKHKTFQFSATAIFISGMLFGAQTASSATTSPDDTDYAEGTTNTATLEGITVWGQAPTEDTTSYTAQEVTVASKLPVALKDIPQSVSVITRQRIEDQNLTTLEDALQQTTGVTIIPNGSGTSIIRSRGHNLNASIDGVPVYNGLGGSEQFDLGIYDRVEVLRGPSALLGGSGDPGGTVNVVTKKPRDAFALNGTLSAGSWNNYRSELDVTGPLNDSGTLRGRAVGIWQDRDFFYDKTHQEKKVFYGVVEYDLTPDTTLSLTFANQTNNITAPYYGLPTYSNGALLDVSRSVNTTPEWAWYNNRTQEYVAGLEQRFDNGWTATGKFRYLNKDNPYKDIFPRGVGVDPQTLTLPYSWNRHYDYEYQRYALDLYVGGPFILFGREHQALIGYNYDDYQEQYQGGRTWGSQASQNDINLFDSSAVQEYDVDWTQGLRTRTIQSGIYGQTRLRLLDPLTWVIGGRISDFSVKERSIAPAEPTGWNQTQSASSELIPYTGLIYELTPQLSLYGSYSETFVPQTDKRADGSTLDPRKGKQYETGIKGSFYDGALNASVAVFRIDDVNRAFSDPNYPDDDFYIAAGKVRSEGWEAEISGSPLPGWDISAGYAYLNTRYLSDDSNIGAFSLAEPKHSFKLWSHYRIAGGLLDGLGFGGGLYAVSNYADARGNGEERYQGGYALLNAALSYPINDNFTVALNAENLTDRKYYASIGGRGTQNVYGTPRNFTLSLHAKF